MLNVIEKTIGQKDQPNRSDWNAHSRPSTWTGNVAQHLLNSVTLASLKLLSGAIGNSGHSTQSHCCCRSKTSLYWNST